MVNVSDRTPFTLVSVRLSSFLEAIVIMARIYFFVLLCFSPWYSTAVSTQTETLDRIRVVVDGHVIMQTDIRAFIDLGLVTFPVGLNQEIEALNYLVERRLVLDQVDRFFVEEPEATEVNRRFRSISDRLSGHSALVAVLARVGMTVEDLRQVLVDDIRREKYLDRRFASISEPRREEARTSWVADLLRRAQVSVVAAEDVQR